MNKETMILNDTLVQLDLIGVYRTFHPKTPEYTFFSSAHGMPCSIDHMIGKKTSLNKLKRVESMQASFPTKRV